MTGATIRAAVETRLNRSESADAINDQITAAVRRIARMGLWPDLHETDSTTLAFTADDKSKDMPSDFETRGLDRLYITDDFTLAPMHPDALRAYQELDDADSNEPTHRAIVGGKCYLYPIPDASYTVKLDHWAIPAAQTEGTLILSDTFQEAVILATMVAYLNDSEGLGTHPKVAESDQKFYEEMAILTGVEDSIPTVAQPFTYGG